MSIYHDITLINEMSQIYRIFFLIFLDFADVMH